MSTTGMLLGRRFVLACLVVIAAGCGSDGGTGSATSSAWRSLGPDGGQILALAVDPVTPSRVLASTAYGGVYRSENGGDSWTQSGLTEMFVFAIAIAGDWPAPIYAAGGRIAAAPPDQGAIFRSDDGGRTWTECDNGVVTSRGYGFGEPPTVPMIEALAIHPRDPAIVYAAGDAEIFRSRDGGRSWDRIVDRGSNLEYVGPLVFDPRAPHALYVGQTDGVARSIDGGATWQIGAVGLESAYAEFGVPLVEVRALAVDPQDSRVLFAGTSEGVYRSTDAGTTWQRTASGLDAAEVVALAPTHPTTVHAGGYRFDDGCEAGCFGVARSDDAGATWSRPEEPVIGGFVRALAIDPREPDRLYAGHVVAGLLRTSDGGRRWSRADRGLTNTFATPILADPQHPTTLYTLFAVRVVRSDDGGETWHERHVGLTRPNVAVLAIDPSRPTTLYAGTQRIDSDFAGSGVHVTRDGAASWAPLGLEGRYIEAITVDPSDSTTLYVGTAPFSDAFGFPSAGGELARSTDGGATWTSLLPFDATDDFARLIRIDPRTPTTIWVVSQRGAILVSTDDGRTWQTRAAGLPEDARVTSLVIDPSEPATLHAGTTAGVFTSHDGGGHWHSSLALGAGNRLAVDVVLDPTDPRTIYAAVAIDQFALGPSAGGGVLRSIDGGITWAPYGDGIPPAGAWTLTLAAGDSRRLYAGTLGTGTYVRDVFE